MSGPIYDKVKHVVEVEDDILAVFTVVSGRDDHMENLSIAKNAKITENFVSNIFAKLQGTFRNMKEGLERDNILGRSKWTITETERIRILIIYEKDCAVIVLIKSNTSLSDTVDNILGYYYESEEPFKAFF